MFLDVGHRERFDDPTPEQIGHHLRSLSAEAPFVVLHSDDAQFIQATPEGDGLRVEWRQEAEQRFMLVPVERAEQSFLAFRRWDEAALGAFPWRRLRAYNDPYRLVAFALAALTAIAVIGAALRVWSAVR
jgi:hypothetical protein